MTDPLPVQPPISCPACSGAGYTVAFIDGQHPNGERFFVEIRRFSCSDCAGSGQIKATHAERITAGDRLRADRLKRGMTLRGEAMRLGVTARELSDRENERG